MIAIKPVYKIKLDDEKKRRLDTIKQIALCVAIILGKGRDEGVYQKALCFELQINNILFNVEETIPIIYVEIGVGYERLDIIIYSWDGEPFKMILELKATNTKIEIKNQWQLLNYMNYKQVDIGAVINFNQGVDGQPLEIAYLIKDDNNTYIYSLTREEGILMKNPNYENGVVDDYAISLVIQHNKALKEKLQKQTKVLKEKKPNKKRKLDTIPDNNEHSNIPPVKV